MTVNEYQIIQQFLTQSCGIELGESRQYLVKNRLGSVMVRFDLPSIADLVALIQSSTPRAEQLKSAIVDAMTTNETFWFRDVVQFSLLKEKVLPEIFARKTGSVRIWSAACSSGQEPYSISICAEEACHKVVIPRNVQIIATDISEAILQDAKAAVYSKQALSRGLDAQAIKLYFQSTHNGFQLNSTIKKNVRFQQFNLLKPFSVLGHFDVIYCRNVLIYFSEQVKIDILKRMVESLEVGGYLFLSSTEAMPAAVKGLKVVREDKSLYYVKV